jgi:hypothetical protein
VFLYLEDRERTLDSPIEKVMLSLATFADELEREKARQRTYDAMLRKAKAGHVTGGRVFGYQNVEVIGADGRRSHVERTIEPAEADVVRTIFRLSAEGHGVKGIAKRLNDRGAPSPRAQQGRSQTWAPTSVRAVLYRPLYRGEIIWNATAKRDTWGQTHQTARPESAWIRRPAPELRIVTEDEWTAAHARLTAARRIYFRHSGPEAGRPGLGSPSKYLLTNLGICGCCGGPLKVLSRSHGNGRKHFYGCAWHHDRGGRACTNGKDVPMLEADDIVLEALIDDVLDPTIIEDSISEALRLLQGDGPNDQIERLDLEIATVSRERDRLVSAIATGGEMGGLLEALRTREARHRSLVAERDARRSQRHLKASETARVREELMTLAGNWQRVLSNDVANARPIVTTLLRGRVTFTPMRSETKCWRMRGEATLGTLFSKTIVALGMASPPGNTRFLLPEIRRSLRQVA